MAQTIRQQKDRQKKMIILLVVLLVATGGVLYFGLGLGGPSAPPPSDGNELPEGGLPNAATPSSNRQIVTVSLDLSVIGREEFMGFELFGDLPIILGEMGRQIPFIAPSF